MAPNLLSCSLVLSMSATVTPRHASSMTTVRNPCSKACLAVDPATAKSSYIYSQINLQGCPIYAKICFLRILIACFSLRTKKLFMAESTDVFLTRFGYYPPPLHCTLEIAVFYGKNIFGRIYGFFHTEFCY